MSEAIAREQYQAAFADLGSTTCAACQGKKKKDQSFCRNCYFRLPPATRNQLYESDGYARTYTAALTLLRQKLGASSK